MSSIRQPPEIQLEVLDECAVGGAQGFLHVVRRQLVARYPSGAVSAPFTYDEVRRRALDAVVICAHYAQEGQRFVFLRSALRPPLLFREEYGQDLSVRIGLWELPAGLIEVEDQNPDGIVRTAQRELMEEVGFRLELSELRPLGPSAFPCPGVLAERHFYFEAEVNPGARGEPALDGSALEHEGVVVEVPLLKALDWCREGSIEDSKTELGLRRLAERFS